MNHMTGEFEEIAPAICASAITIDPPSSLNTVISGHFQGSVFVTRRAGTYLEGEYRRRRLYTLLELMSILYTGKLYNSIYGSPDDIEHITNCFDRVTKLVFKDSSSTAFIRFGTVRDNDPSVDIKNGQIKMPGFVNRCHHALRS